MGEERCSVSNTRDDRSVGILARLPRLLAETRIRLPVNSRMSPQALRQLPLVLIRIVPQAQMINNLRNRLALALLLEVLHRKGHLRLDLCAIARELRLREWDVGDGIALSLCGRSIGIGCC